MVPLLEVGQEALANVGVLTPQAVIEQAANSRKDRSNEIPMHVGEPEVAPLELVGELLVIEAEQVQNGRLQIVNVHRIVGNVEAELIR